MTDPTATEESHPWVDNDRGGQDNLTAALAQHIWNEWGQYEIRVCEENMMEIAQVALSLPAIQNALEMVVVGPSDD